MVLAAELAAGRIIEVDPEVWSDVSTSPFGVIPKSGQANRWILINDLSSPASRSANDLIDCKCCSIRYACVDTAASLVCKFGKGSLIAKLDLR